MLEKKQKKQKKGKFLKKNRWKQYEFTLSLNVK